MGIKLFSKGIERCSMGIKLFSKGIERCSMGIKLFSKGIEQQGMAIEQQGMAIERRSIGIEQQGMAIEPRGMRFPPSATRKELCLRVLGIDPGTRHLGWGVLDRVGGSIRHVAHGVIDTEASASIAERLVVIDDALTLLVAEHAPNAASVEALFFAKDAQAASKLGHARGVILLRLIRAGVAIHEYPPARVKRAVAGSGQATKEQVQRTMMQLLSLTVAPRLDASDALANAFAHLAMAPFEEAMRRMGVVTKPKAPRRRPRFG